MDLILAVFAFGMLIPRYSWHASKEREILIAPGAFFEVLRNYAEANHNIIELRQLPAPMRISDLKFKHKVRSKTPCQMERPHVSAVRNCSHALRVMWTLPYDGGEPLTQLRLQWRERLTDKNNAPSDWFEVRPLKPGTVEYFIHSDVDPLEDQYLTASSLRHFTEPAEKKKQQILKQKSRAKKKSKNVEKATESTKKDLPPPLQPGYEYEVRMKAVNTLGECEFWSCCDDAGGSNVARTRPNLPQAPAGPFSVQICDLGQNITAKVAWHHPPDGGSPIIEYLVEFCKLKFDSGQDAMTRKLINYNRLSLKKLSPGESYAVRVSTRNEAGWSQPSSLQRVPTSWRLGDMVANVENGVPTERKYAVTKLKGDEVATLKLRHEDTHATLKTPTEQVIGFTTPVEGEYIEALKEIVHNVTKDGWTSMHFACGRGHTQFVPDLIQAKANVNLCTKSGEAPLHFACKRGVLQIVQYLLNARASVGQSNHEGKGPMFFAAVSGNLDVAEALVAAKASVNNPRQSEFSPLGAAAMQGHAPIVQLLIGAKAFVHSLNKNRATALHLACKHGREEVVSILLDAKAELNAITEDDCTPLFFAAGRSHENIVGILIEMKAALEKPNKAMYTPLHIACEKNSESVVRQLLSANASVQAPASGNLRPLHIAAFASRSMIVENLLNEEAEVEARTNDGATALHLAALRGCKLTVDLLLTRHAIVNACTNAGTTPLLYATKENNIAVVKALLMVEADPNMLDVENRSAILIAASKGYREIVALLLKYDADFTQPSKTGWTPLHAGSRAFSVAIAIGGFKCTICDELLTSIDIHAYTPLTCAR